MRILYVVHQFFPQWYTGTERFVLDLARQMRKMGHYVEVLTYGFDDDAGFSIHDGVMHKKYQFQNIPVTSLRHVNVPEDLSFNIFDNKFESILNTIITKENFDLVHVVHPMRLGYATKVAHSAGLPTILTLTDFWVICPGVQLLTPSGKLCYGSSDPQKCVKDCYGELWADKLTRRFKEIEELVRMVDCIVAPTHFLASLVKNVLDLHISFIPYGIDYRYIKEIPGKSGENLTLGFIGTFMPHKGVHTLIEAIKLLDDNAIRVKIYGDPSHHPNYYSQLTSVADNDKRIEFTGKYDYSEISMILSELDMVVVPSIWWENAPFTIQTSFAYKTPVIASNLGGMSEVVRDGVNGLLFEAGNAENLAEVIRKITTNQGVLNRIRENIISPPRIEEVAFEYEKIYSDLIVKRSFKRVNIDHINNMKEIRKNFAISRDNSFFDFKNKTYKSIKLINMNNLKIITRISKGDTMFQGNLDPYFSVGMSALQCIEIALFIANKKSTDIKNILDFACGYGRVMRIIKAAFPKAVITACELDKEAVDYCAKTFCAIPAYSSKRVSEIKIDDSFDLIWNGSLLTHLDSDLWVEYLRLFESLLNPNGILIFTVHGCLVADKLKKGDNDYYGLDQTGVSKVLKDYEDHGFGYANYCNQSDYGISIASPSWVLSCLENIPNLQVLAYVEHLWGNHQDVVICIKDFEWYRKRESKVDLTTMEEICLTPIAGKSQQAIVNINGEIRSIYKTKYDNDFILDIDKRDEMYQFLVTHPDIKDPIAEYFHTGELMLTNLQEIFEDIGYGFNQIDSFLDFAGGYGRFTRFLIQKLSHEKITISDIDKTAVDFGKKTFGVNGFYSVDNPKRLIHDNKYDVIYVASLFSHLSLRLWGGWLKRLYDTLNEGGMLIFSTHGSYCYDLLDDETRTHVKKVEEGFFYIPLSETKRLSTKNYGTTYVTYDYVKKVIRQNNLQKLIGFYPKKLCNYQDIYVIQKEITKTSPVELVEEVK